MLAGRELNGMAKVACAASGASAPTERAHDVLDALHDLTPYECATFTAWDPISVCHRTFANASYPEAVLRLFESESFREETERFVAAPWDLPLRMRDLPCDPASVRSIAEVLWPAGFNEGMTMRLYAPGGRYVGLLNMSTSSTGHPTDGARTAITLLAGTLGNALDGSHFARFHLRCGEPDTAAVTIRADGSVAPLPGMHVDPLLCGDAGPVQAARRLLRTGDVPGRFLWPATDGAGWRPVRVVPCDEPTLDQGEAVVVLGPPTSAHSLTRREIEILSLIVLGWSNPQIAERFVVARRTVATHVEHILEKLSEPSRTTAACRAVREGLRFPVPPRG